MDLGQSPRQHRLCRCAGRAQQTIPWPARAPGSVPALVDLFRSQEVAQGLQQDMEQAEIDSDKEDGERCCALVRASTPRNSLRWREGEQEAARSRHADFRQQRPQHARQLWKKEAQAERV